MMRLLAIAGLACAVKAQILAPGNLRCEYLHGRPVIDTRVPRFFWTPRHTEADQRQTAYHIQVTTDPSFARIDQWDSAKTRSSESIHVEYGGRALQSDSTYYWRVRYWDATDRPSPFSAPAVFETALLDASQWKGSWLGNPGLFRREFILKGKPFRARAYVAAAGWVELTVNGQRSGDAVLDPGWANYRRRVLYTVHDVTSMLQAGRNTVIAALGRGRATQPATAIELRITLESGERVVIASDGAWETTRGPVISADIYDGETYDARGEAAEWKPAKVVEAPGGALALQSMPPIRVLETIHARSVSTPAPGVFVFDFGRNMSGWVRLRLSGPRRATVRLRYAEALLADGSLNRETLRRAKAEDVYIARGEGVEYFEPKFTYHGFRYVEVTGYPGTPSIEDVVARAIGSDLKVAGRFACSNNLVNSIQTALLWTLRSNLMSIPTDNNQRDERLGWLGDAHVTFDVVSANFDAAAFYTNYARVIADEQNDQGDLPNTAPYAEFPGAERHDPAWGSAYPLLVWHLWREYGDRRAVMEHYARVRKFVDHLGASPRESRFGDWVALESTPKNMVADFYYALDLNIVSELARVAGQARDAERYAKLAAGERAGFGERYAGVKTKTAYALRLTLDPSAKVTFPDAPNLSTGMIGTRHLLDALTTAGRADVAWRFLTQRTYPSWGFMLANGATTFWELWRFREDVRMKSHNQPMLGGALVWLYQALAGIRAGDAGYRRLTIRPIPVGDLEFVSATRDTVSGPVSVSWRRSHASRLFQLSVAIPVNTTASIVLPDNTRREVGSGSHSLKLTDCTNANH